jgi:hypothetical protein
MRRRDESFTYMFQQEYDGYVRELTLEVCYRVYGRYHRATWNDPEEFPELEITDIAVGDLVDEYGEPVCLTPDRVRNILAWVEHNLFDVLEEKCMATSC